jgi:hypothetical protein
MRIFGIVVLLLIVCIGIPAGLWEAHVALSDHIGKGNAEIQINSAGSRIVNYDHYFNLCASVQNAEASIDAQTDLLKTTTNADDQGRINANIAALQTVRATGVNQYNADSAKEYTEARFKASNLPYRLDTTPYKAGGQKTQCAY